MQLGYYGCTNTPIIQPTLRCCAGNSQREPEVVESMLDSCSGLERKRKRKRKNYVTHCVTHCIEGEPVHVCPSKWNARICTSHRSVPWAHLKKESHAGT